MHKVGYIAHRRGRRSRQFRGIGIVRLALAPAAGPEARVTHDHLLPENTVNDNIYLKNALLEHYY